MKISQVNKLVVRLAGEDVSAYVSCSEQTQKRIRIIGVLVAIIFVLSFLSILEAFSSFFGSILVGLSLGLFFAWLVTNMYLLLLYTLTKNSLVPSNVKARSQRTYFIRILTLCMLALIISKPIEHFLFKNNVRADVTRYKNNQRLQYLSAIDGYYSKMEAEAERDVAQIMSIAGVSDPAFLSGSDIILFNLAKDRLTSINSERMSTRLQMLKVLESNSYYIKTLREISKHNYSWLFSGFVCVLFILPTVLKRRISFGTNYAIIKEKRARSAVELEYQTFKTEYTHAISVFTNEDLVYSEPFEDPPYNYSRFEDRSSPQSEQTFLDQIYGS